MSSDKTISVLDFLAGLLRPWFGRRFFRGDTWAVWKVFLSAVFALPLTPEQLATFQRHTGRERPSVEGYQEIFAIVGRGGGKSIIAAAVGVFLAVFREYKTLVPGEIATGVILASDRRQAGVILSYVRAFLTQVPELAKLIAGQTQDSITVRNGANLIKIEIHTSDFRAVRGYSMAFCICDEVSFWATSDDAASPDTEILTAVKPALARIPGSVLLCISSPYAERGEVWKNFKEHFGKVSPVLVWKGTTREHNQTFPQRVIDRALADDAARASAEYLAEFRADLADFLSRITVESCVAIGRAELPPGLTFNTSYKAFYDASGGVRDSAVLSIAHHSNGKAILDLLAEREAPFSPADAVFEHAQILKRYNCFEVWGDKYSGTWCQDEFRRQGIEYRFSELDRSGIYLFALAVINSGRTELLDHEKLVNQLCGLKRRTGTQGRDTIDHSAGAHDDVANAACGALFLARDSFADNSLIEFEKANLAGKYNAETDAAKRFREGWARAEQNLAHYKGQPIKETWAKGLRGFRFGEIPPHCPTPECAGTVQKLPHNECRCQLCGAQFFREGEQPPQVNYGGDRRTMQQSGSGPAGAYWQNMQRFSHSRGGRP